MRNDQATAYTLGHFMAVNLRGICATTAFFSILLTCSSNALEFPAVSCVSPTATVTHIEGIDSQRASMEGKYTLPDIQSGCYQGYVDQGGTQPPERCIEANKGLLSHPPLQASANCATGSLRLDGRNYRMPVTANCVTGGIYASKAFKTLCPNYRGKIEAD